MEGKNKVKKILITLICIATILGIGGCGNGKKTIDDKLSDNKVSVKCEEKRCSIISNDKTYVFSFSKIEKKDSFQFTNLTDKGAVIYFPKDGNTVIGLKDDKKTYVLPSQIDDCPESIKSLDSNAKRKYTDTLKALDVSEKELFDYLKEQYKKSFV